MSSYKEENRKRLISLLSSIKENTNPNGWKHVASIAVGGLLSVGFSKQGSYLLVVSSQGRGVINCDTGEKVGRDDEPYEGLSENSLSCFGIGPIEGEEVTLSGLNGGGLPQTTSKGESLELVAPNWPEYDLIFCQNYKNALVPGHQSECSRIYTEHVRAFGFSWCGNYMVAACGSDLDLWKRETKL
jgi:hypothetical protein